MSQRDTKMSQSPAGSAADFHLWRRMRSRGPQSPCRNPPQGPPPISTHEALTLPLYKKDVAIPRRVRRRFPPLVARLSQLAAAKVAIPRRVRRRFPLGPSSAPRPLETWCRNPPQGPPPISTQMIRGPPALYDSCRNPPQGPPPISTSSSTARAGGTSRSQSPAGSAADFHHPPHFFGGGLLVLVAIPRRVRRRFPPPPEEMGGVFWFFCRNPPQGPPPISTKVGIRSLTNLGGLSQSPAGSAADFHQGHAVSMTEDTGCRNPPQGPPPISTPTGCCWSSSSFSVSQSPAGSAADFHLSPKVSSPISMVKCRNPPQGPPPISTKDSSSSSASSVFSRNPPQGPPPISTFAMSTASFARFAVAIPRRVRRRFPLLVRRQATPANTKCRNPPQGPPPISTASSPPRTKIRTLVVAIPRRVRRRFPRLFSPGPRSPTK
mgnify:CR=1 FL=1